MTNQASEDELSADDLTALLFDHFDNSMPVEVDRHYGEHLLYRLIRTEKLKLLAEVREQAIPNPTTPAGKNEFVSLEALSKLEAEL